MATFYIDPSQSVNGTGTELSPFNVFPTNVSSGGFINGDVFLFKRGTKYFPVWGGADGDCFTVNRSITIGAYGNGEKPVITGTYTGTGNGKLFRFYNPFVIQDIVFKDTALCHILYAQGSITDGAVLNCEFYNVAQTTPTLFHNALTLPVSGQFTNSLRIQGNIIKGVGNDAILASCSNRCIISDNIIQDVSLTAPNGDCIAVIGDCVLLEVYNNVCSHTSRNTKQCFIQDGGTSTGWALIYNNVFEGWFDDANPNHTGVYLSLPGKISRNIIKTWRSGVFLNASNITVESNLIIQGGGSPSTGAIWSTFNNLNIINNTIVRLPSVELSDAAIRNNTSGSNSKIQNNIIINFNTGIRKENVTIESHNLFYQVNTPVVDATNTPVIMDATDLNTNPLLTTSYGLTNNSPAKYSGIFNNNRDLENVIYNNTPSRGCYEFKRTRAVVTNRGVR